MFGVERVEKRVDVLETKVARLERLLCDLEETVERLRTDKDFYKSRLDALDRATQEWLTQYGDMLRGLTKDLQRLKGEIKAIKQDIAKYWQHQNKVERKVMEMDSNIQYLRRFDVKIDQIANLLQRMRRFRAEAFIEVAALIRALQGGKHGEGGTGTGT